ncbi:MAG: NDP-hexose 4-ketoreductase, partial [Chloroflexi bacterium]
DTIKRGVQLGFNVPLDEEKSEQEAYQDLVKNVTDQLRRAFRPEFLNRVDATIFFRSLTREETKRIVDLELNKVRERLIEHAITLDVTEAARGWLADKGYDPEFGARPLRRLIQNEIEDRLSDGILSGEFSIGCVVRVDVNEDGELVLSPVEENDEALETPSV